MITTTIATGAVLATVFSLLKPFAEVLVSPEAPLHDPALRLLVIVLGAVVGAANLALFGGALTLHSVSLALLGGAGDGVAAITLYHLVPGNFLPGTVTPTPAPAPDQAPAPVPPTTTALIVPATAAIAPVAPIVAEA